MTVWQSKKQRLVMAAAIGTVLLAGTAWLWKTHVARSDRPAAKPVYTASGMGGYGAAPAALRVLPASHSTPGATVPTDQTAQDLYNNGNYEQAEAASEQIIRANAGATDDPHRRQVVTARTVLAYGAARRHDLPLARERFGELRQAAAALPDGGKPEAPMGENPPTAEEDGAYEHAVCTAAMGDSKGAEAEYLQFMRRYPESPLVHAAVKRIARMHGGNIPHEAQAVWQAAMKIGEVQEKGRQREASLCGPECLGELLRRREQGGGVEGWKGGGEKQGGWVDGWGEPKARLLASKRDGTTGELVHALAVEMGTDENGTTMESLVRTAQRHGLRSRGLALTLQGLQQQKLPLIALISPAHYVLVDAAGPAGVTVWDPDGQGIGKAATRQYSVAEWTRVWRGVGIVMG